MVKNHAPSSPESVGDVLNSIVLEGNLLSDDNKLLSQKLVVLLDERKKFITNISQLERANKNLINSVNRLLNERQQLKYNDVLNTTNESIQSGGKLQARSRINSDIIASSRDKEINRLNNELDQEKRQNSSVRILCNQVLDRLISSQYNQRYPPQQNSSTKEDELNQSFASITLENLAAKSAELFKNDQDKIQYVTDQLSVLEAIVADLLKANNLNDASFDVVSSIKAEINNIKSQVPSHSSELLDLNGTYEKKISSLLETNESLQAKNKECSKTNHNLEKRIERLKNEMKLLSGEIEMYKERASQAEKNQQEIVAANKQILTENHHLVKENSQSHAKIEEIVTERNELLSILGSQDNADALQSITIKQNISNLVNENKQLAHANHELSDKVDEFELQLTNARSQYDNDMLKHTKQYDSQSEQIAALLADVVALREYLLFVRESTKQQLLDMKKETQMDLVKMNRVTTQIVKEKLVLFEKLSNLEQEKAHVDDLLATKMADLELQSIKLNESTALNQQQEAIIQNYKQMMSKRKGLHRRYSSANSPHKSRLLESFTQQRALNALKNSAWFSSLSDKILQLIFSKFFKQEQCNVGEVLIHQDEIGDMMYFVVEGELSIEVKQNVTSESKPITKRGPGKLVGEYGMITGLPRTATVRVSQQLACLSISFDEFKSMYYYEGELSRDEKASLKKALDQIISKLVGGSFEEIINHRSKYLG